MCKLNYNGCKKLYENYFNSDTISNFIIELRTKILKITINEFIYDMGWSNEKYYSKIVNGYINNKNKKVYSNPTIKYIFGGISHAMNHNKKWNENKIKIEELIIKYFFRW